MVEDGDPIPDPASLDRVSTDPEVREVARLLVRAELPGKAVRLNITLDEGLLAAVDRAARARGFTRSGFLAEAARRLLAAPR